MNGSLMSGRYPPSPKTKITKETIETLLSGRLKLSPFEISYLNIHNKHKLPLTGSAV